MKKTLIRSGGSSGCLQLIALTETAQFCSSKSAHCVAPPFRGASFDAAVFDANSSSRRRSAF